MGVAETSAHRAELIGMEMTSIKMNMRDTPYQHETLSWPLPESESPPSLKDSRYVTDLHDVYCARTSLSRRGSTCHHALFLDEHVSS
jgi:hypothetical protein